ncbi:BQ5605_C030g10844 [Microbotryum silenes-dioicae]|uniref:Eukaryotic translation initiation factor 3 subunit M n=1 Tax=Microbotryum silenes-dioicae TaxID=796604 RepID=A0A2X0PJ09_9BASI|nr:BQ5605_C030g10844 [Microbotryum silenes-dioicae]
MTSTTTANGQSDPSSSSCLAFQDEFTNSHGGRCFFVAVEPVFEEQISQLATVIARSSATALTEAQRTDYVQQHTTTARQASPSKPVTEDDAALDESTTPPTPPVTEDQLEQRRTLLEQLLRDLKGVRIQALDREFQGFAHLFLSLILSTYKVTDQAFSKTILDLVDTLAFSQGKNVQPTLSTRYATLANVFNSLDTQEKVFDGLRLQVVEKLVEAAAQNDDYLVIEPVVRSLETWLVQWGFAGEPISNENRQKGDEAVLKIVTLLNKGQQIVPRLTLVEKDLLIGHLSHADAEAGSKTQNELASHLIALVLRLPNEYDFTTLSNLQALQQPSTQVLSQVLNVFLQPGSTVQDLDQLLSSDSVVPQLESFGLEVEKLKNKLRLISLSELCSTRVGQRVPYNEISKVLNLSISTNEGGEGEEEELVENWVIDAIRAGLISGRLQSSETKFWVTKATSPRSFGKDEWEVLEKRLGEWRGSLDSILESVKRGLTGGVAQGGAQDVVSSRSAGAGGREATNEKEMIAV